MAVNIVIGPGLGNAKGCATIALYGIDVGPCDDFIITSSTSFQLAELPANATLQFYDNDG